MVLSLKRAHIAGAYHASYSSYAKGVSTLVTKAMPISIHAFKTDAKGRYVILVVQLMNRLMTFVNLYMPPPFSPSHLDDMIWATYEVAEGSIFILGDFNTVADLALDASSGTPATLMGWLSTHGLEMSGAFTILTLRSTPVFQKCIIRSPE